MKATKVTTILEDGTYCTIEQSTGTQVHSVRGGTLRFCRGIRDEEGRVIIGDIREFPDTPETRIACDEELDYVANRMPGQPFNSYYFEAILDSVWHLHEGRLRVGTPW